MKKKYLFITTTLANGGAERVISILASSIAALGQDVCILKYYEVENEYPVSDQVKIINLSDGRLADYQKLSYFEKIRKIRLVLKEQRPDFVIPFLFQLAMATALAALGVKTTTIQSIRINPAVAPVSKVKRMLRDGLVYASKCTFVQNESQRAYFPSRYHKKIHVLFNPVSDGLLSCEWNPPEESFIVCGLGRLEDQKNFKLLMDAFKKAFSDCDNAVLRIYGHGSLEEELREYAAACGLGDRIRLMGRSNDVRSVFQNSSLFVLSSDYEGMPNALIEAMAVGVPCISTDCPTGPRDLIQNCENGLLVPVGDVEALARAMRSIYEKQFDTKQMGLKAKESIRKQCSSDQIARKMIDICEQIR